MKILHTSDWHLGHMLYNYDRTEEQLVMLLQMVQIVKDRQPDVFLLCGDVFHTPQPSAAVQTMFTESLVKIHEAQPNMTIVVTAGNHDSSSRHEIFRTPWQALNVYTVGQLQRDNMEKHIIEIPGKGYVVAIPYCHERNIPEGFFQQLLDKVTAMNTEKLPVVMTAHTTISGCDYRGHDHATGYAAGGIDAMDLKMMGSGYDYLALGHIHHEQYVHSGYHDVRYSGTPLPVSFDESYEHSVSLVEINQHGEQPRVERITIENPRPLVTLPREFYATWEEAKKLLMDFPSDIPAYIRLNVRIDDFLPAEARAEADLLTENKACRFCVINASRLASTRSDARAMTVHEFQEEKPIDIAERYASDMNICFDEDMRTMFQEVLTLVEEEARNE